MSGAELHTAKVVSARKRTATLDHTEKKVSNIKRISLEEAQELLEQGHTYVDVRSIPEFEAGHVPGAFNVPVMHLGPGGMEPNPDFLKVMQATFANDAQLVLGCKSGMRSRNAGQILAQAGYTNAVDLRTGWDGCKDAFGRIEPGWGKQGLAVETGQPEGRSYQALEEKRST
jgi:rhodanese-related sulfurtransferase